MRLCFYYDHFKTAIESYQLPDEQLYYTGCPLDCVTIAQEDLDRHCVLGIVDNVLVTFFVLHQKKEITPYPPNNHSLLLRAFSTDVRYQGNGYAKRALMLLPAFINEHFQEIHNVLLEVDVKNTLAQKVYKTCGFVDEGARRMGSKGELILMKKYIEQA